MFMFHILYYIAPSYKTIFFSRHGNIYVVCVDMHAHTHIKNLIRRILISDTKEVETIYESLDQETFGQYVRASILDKEK